MKQTSCGTSLIAGASFSLHPMSDNFIEVIEQALAETDTSKVWLETDDVTTTVRGKVVHVFDVTKAICVHASRTGKHIAFQATYSIGCPQDATGDVYLALDDIQSNEMGKQENNFYAAAKFSLYPLSERSYMETIFKQIDEMKRHVNVSQAHYSTKLTGGVIDIFNGLERVFQQTVEGGSNHTVMTLTLSANSPSHK